MDLINYLADDSGEIHSMKIKQFYQNAQSLNEGQLCSKCNSSVVDEGVLCVSCDLEEASYLIHSFHDTWEYPPNHKQRVNIEKQRGYFDWNSLEYVRVA